MEINDAFAARGLMEPVDVLRDDGTELSFLLELRETPVRRVRLHRFIRDELGAVKAEKLFGVPLKERMAQNRLRGIFVLLPVQPVCTAEIRDAGLRGHARAAEKDDVVAPGDPLAEHRDIVLHGNTPPFTKGIIPTFSDIRNRKRETAIPSPVFSYKGLARVCSRRSK